MEKKIARTTKSLQFSLVSFAFASPPPHFLYSMVDPKA